MGSEWGHVGSYSVHLAFRLRGAEQNASFRLRGVEKQRGPGWGPVGSVMVLNCNFCCFVEEVRLLCNGVRGACRP